jgi:hypothetical protein
MHHIFIFSRYIIVFLLCGPLGAQSSSEQDLHRDEIYRAYQKSYSSELSTIDAVQQILSAPLYQAYNEDILGLKEKWPVLTHYRLPGAFLVLSPSIQLDDLSVKMKMAHYKIVMDIQDPRKIRGVNFGPFPQNPDRVLFAETLDKDNVLLLIDTDTSSVFGISVFDQRKTEIETLHRNNVRALKLLNDLDRWGFRESLAEYRHDNSEVEKAAIQRLRNADEASQIHEISLEEWQEFVAAEDSILIILDTHSEASPLQLLQKLSEDEAIDWVGVEFSQAYGDLLKNPEALDDLKAMENSPPKGNANGMFIRRRFSPEGVFVPTYQVLDSMLKAGRDIRFLDTDAYIFTGKDYLGVLALLTSIRNQFMVERIPKTGRGLILVGGVHIEFPVAINLQDFIAERFPDRKIFVLK